MSIMRKITNIILKRWKVVLWYTLVLLGLKFIAEFLCSVIPAKDLNVIMVMWFIITMLLIGKVDLRVDEVEQDLKDITRKFWSGNEK